MSEHSCCRSCDDGYDTRPKHDKHSDWHKLTAGQKFDVLRVVVRAKKLNRMVRLKYLDGDVYAFPNVNLDLGMKWGIDNLAHAGGVSGVHYRGLILNVMSMKIDLKAHRPRWQWPVWQRDGTGIEREVLAR